MLDWGRSFTCIAPDSPGYGQSQPFADPDVEIADFADAVVQFLDAIGIDRIAAYGFHSGGIILVTALRRHPDRFSALAIGGYAVWTDAERKAFSDNYLPAFVPSPYGEHLTWLWHRILEQSWFFPWFDARPATRMAVAHADPARIDGVVREMLDAGDAYRAGYGAVLRAARDIPDVDEPTSPVLITAYDGDPLQAHVDRLGELPPQWQACKVATPAQHHAQSIAFLAYHALPVGPLKETDEEGFVTVRKAGFDGLVHWRGKRGGMMRVAAPGRSAELIDAAVALVVDPPGHGWSDNWTESAPVDPAAWQTVLTDVAEQLGATDLVYEPAPVGEVERLFPDLTPDRFGAYLAKAWAIVRAGHFFTPWYAADAAHAAPFDTRDIAPERLALEHRALLEARAPREWLQALRAIEASV